MPEDKPIAPLDLRTPGRFHVVGVGGPGMSAVALVLVEMGHAVSGSDLRELPVLDRLRSAGVEVHDREQVAMTVPVQTSQSNGLVRMRFFLPAKFSRENAPMPVDDRVRLVTIPAETIAILRYSGSGIDRVQRQAELTAALAPSPWRRSGEPYTLNYDAPFTLSFLRRNEAAVAVEKVP